MSSLEARYSKPSTTSAISSETFGPIMWQPSSSSVLASAMNFTKPVVSPSERARPLALNGKRPVLYARPLSFTTCSGSPTVAISGHV